MHLQTFQLFLCVVLHLLIKKLASKVLPETAEFLAVTGFPLWVSTVVIGIVCTFYTTVVSNMTVFFVLIA